MSLQRYKYGAGGVYITPTNGANITPIKLFDIEDSSYSIKAKVTAARGSSVYNVVSGRSEEDMSGKIKFLRDDPRIAAFLFHGVDITPGMQSLAEGENAVCAATVTVANASTFLYDEGVLNGNDGSAFTRVTSAPNAGQYSCNTAGQYVFNAADVAAHVPGIFSYTYGVANTGFGYTVTNQSQGNAPFFRLHLRKAYNSPSGLMTEDVIIYAAQATSMSGSGKAGAVGDVEIDGQAQADALGRVYSRYVNGAAI